MVYMLYVLETNTVDDVDKGLFQLAYSNCVVEICQMTNPSVASAGLSGTVTVSYTHLTLPTKDGV